MDHDPGIAQRRLPQYNVVILKDDLRSREVVQLVLEKAAGLNPTMAFQKSMQYIATGRAVVRTVHQELAELYEERLRALSAKPTPLNPMGKPLIISLQKT